jgi:hypothetical protein
MKWVLRALSPEIKRPVREADHSPPSSAEVKNVWGYTITPQYVFKLRCLGKQSDNFSFTYLKALTRHLAGRTEKNHDMSQDRRYPGQDMNL